MVFVANFLENTTVKDFENWPTFVEVMNECIVARYFWLTVYFVVSFYTTRPLVSQTDEQLPPPGKSI